MLCSVAATPGSHSVVLSGGIVIGAAGLVAALFSKRRSAHSSSSSDGQLADGATDQEVREAVQEVEA